MASPRGGISDRSTPICRCRVLYLGSAVPHITKDGLQGVQAPLRELYPDQGAQGARGIDSWMSVWSNGLLLENVDENHKKVTRFFPIETLHYCAAVRYVMVPGTTSSGSTEKVARFLPLDSPFARNPNIHHPPLFACILRRTTGIKVLECHAFICKREVAANALVRCCFHAYADSSYARRLETNGGGSVSAYGTLQRPGSESTQVATANLEKVEDWTSTNGISVNGGTNHENGGDEISIYNGDENHKVWAGSPESREAIYAEYGGTNTLRSIHSGASSSRSQRPRQMVLPSKPPPPETDDDKTKKKDKNKKKPHQHQQHQQHQHHQHRREDEIIYSNTPVVMNGGGGSATLMRPMSAPNGMVVRPSSASLARQPIYVIAPPPPPHGKKKHAGTYSGKMKKGMMPQPIPAPFLVPAGPHGQPMVPMPAPPRRHHAMEEPIYMPSARPGSPQASYQPAHFPHDAYLMQQYATTDRRVQRRPASRKASPEEEASDTSPFNTGIYRRKGHLNERAFSYSIRQEHRSRSHGSLASLRFAEAPPSPASPAPREVLQKEREIRQLVRDLDLSGDEIERMEVPAGVYPRPPPRH